MAFHNGYPSSHQDYDGTPPSCEPSQLPLSIYALLSETAIDVPPHQEYGGAPPSSGPPQPPLGPPQTPYGGPPNRAPPHQGYGRTLPSGGPLQPLSSPYTPSSGPPKPPYGGPPNGAPYPNSPQGYAFPPQGYVPQQGMSKIFVKCGVN